MNTQPTHYEILGVLPSATGAEIKKKYNELAHALHPYATAESQARFSEIKAAYEVIGDPLERAVYDSQLTDASVWATPPAFMESAFVIDVSNLIREAEFALMSGDAPGAKILCEAAVVEDPENVVALSLLGDSLAAMKLPKQALDAYRRADDIRPTYLLQSKIDQMIAEDARSLSAKVPTAAASSGNVFSRLFSRAMAAAA